MIFSPQKVIKENKPKIVKAGTNYYILVIIYFISKEEFKNKSKLLYIKTLINENKKIKSPLPEDNDIIIDTIQELYEFILSYCNLNDNKKEYKINIYEGNLNLISNNSQLMNYKGNIIYVKISRSKEYKIKKKLEINKSLSCSLSKLSTLTPSFYKNNIQKFFDFKSSNTTFTNKLFPPPENVSNNSSLLFSETYRRNYHKNFSQSPSSDLKSFKNEESKIEQKPKFPYKIREKIRNRNRLIIRNKDKTNIFFQNYQKYILSSSEYFSKNFLPYKLYPNRGQLININKLKKSCSSKLFIPEISTCFNLSNISSLSNNGKTLKKSDRSLSNEKQEKLNIMRKFLAIQKN